MLLQRGGEKNLAEGKTTNFFCQTGKAMGTNFFVACLDELDATNKRGVWQLQLKIFKRRGTSRTDQFVIDLRKTVKMDDFLLPNQDINENVQINAIITGEKVDKKGKPYFTYRIVVYHAKNNHQYVMDTCPNLLIVDYDPELNQAKVVSKAYGKLPAMHNRLFFISPNFLYTKEFHTQRLVACKIEGTEVACNGPRFEFVE
jgi:hypothetical protein